MKSVIEVYAWMETKRVSIRSDADNMINNILFMKWCNFNSYVEPLGSLELNANLRYCRI